MSQDASQFRAADILAPDGPVARRLENYEIRPEQLELAKACEEALEGGSHLVAEAGTGVGKSFAYLLPAVLYSLRHPDQGPVVISTRTIALQEQLAERDLPFLRAVLPLEWTAVTAVGRNNYVCMRRLERAMKDGGELFDDRARANELTRVEDWANQSQEGLRFELDPPVTDVVWEEVRAEHGNCLYKACKYFEACGFQRARRRLETAQILVVNHSLYVADLQLRGAGAQVLPSHRVVIFDEAHHLERTATEGLGARATLGSVLWHLRRIRPKGKRRSLAPELERGSVHALFEVAEAAAEEFFGRLGDRLGNDRRSPVAIPQEESIDVDFIQPLVEIVRECSRAAAATTEVDRKMELSARAKGLQTFCLTMQALCAPNVQDDENVRPTVRWIEPERRGVALRSAPLEVGPILRDLCFHHPRTAILTSATLGPAEGQFRWLRDRLGLAERVQTLRVGSPFDYHRQVRLTIAEGLPDPGREPDAFRRAAANEARDRILANDGRALILCTSWRSVREFRETLENALAMEGIPLLVHGDAPAQDLIARKRNDPRSVLLGTDTFWEGVDLPGDAVTMVLIERLPFGQPDHPLTKARQSAIEQRGGDAFGEMSLPEALLKFRQGFGRLIRRGDDHGEVVVLDPRLRTRRYGEAFLRALPEGTTTPPDHPPPDEDPAHDARGSLDNPDSEPDLNDWGKF
ncbi:MAG: ATP-dependent DNA helicase [Planctomycetota bacterium]